MWVGVGERLGGIKGVAITTVLGCMLVKSMRPPVLQSARCSKTVFRGQGCCTKGYLLPRQKFPSLALASGVAFSKNVSSSTDNIGYIIPYSVVRRGVDVGVGVHLLPAPLCQSRVWPLTLPMSMRMLACRFGTSWTSMSGTAPTGASPVQASSRRYRARAAELCTCHTHATAAQPQFALLPRLWFGTFEIIGLTPQSFKCLEVSSLSPCWNRTAHPCLYLKPSCSTEFHAPTSATCLLVPLTHTCEPHPPAQDLENPAQRAYLKVPEHRSGVLVVKLDPLSPVASVLKENDVVLEVAGQPVADDGTAVFRDDERLEYTHLIRSMHVGDRLQLTILRAGQELQVRGGYAWEGKRMQANNYGLNGLEGRELQVRGKLCGEQGAVACAVS